MVKKMVVLFFVSILVMFSCSGPTDSTDDSPSAEKWSVVYTITSSTDNEVATVEYGRVRYSDSSFDTSVISSVALPWSYSTTMEADTDYTPYLGVYDNTGVSGTAQSFSVKIFLTDKNGTLLTTDNTFSANDGSEVSLSTYFDSITF